MYVNCFLEKIINVQSAFFLSETTFNRCELFSDDSRIYIHPSPKQVNLQFSSLSCFMHLFLSRVFEIANPEKEFSFSIQMEELF